MASRALVVRVKKDSNGNVKDIMLDNGQIHSIDEALEMSRKGLIEDIVIKHGENGTEYYRRSPTTHGDDSFDHLPQF